MPIGRREAVHILESVLDRGCSLKLSRVFSLVGPQPAIQAPGLHAAQVLSCAVFSGSPRRTVLRVTRRSGFHVMLLLYLAAGLLTGTGAMPCIPSPALALPLVHPSALRKGTETESELLHPDSPSCAARQGSLDLRIFLAALPSSSFFEAPRVEAAFNASTCDVSLVEAALLTAAEALPMLKLPSVN